MNKNKKKGFTLVELLAVIAVLALILIIAVPKITKTLDNSKKRTLELSVKSIAKSAEKAYIENQTYGIKEEITCESVTNMSKNEYEICAIEFDNEGNASVTIIGKGSYKGLKVCDGTKEDASITSSGECPVIATTYITNLLDQESSLMQTSAEYNGTTYDAGIRYVGEMDEVKNKVYYNCDDTDSTGVSYGSEGYNYAQACEVWRIIGVFDVKSSTSGKSEKRVKLINTNSTFTASWDSSASGINSGYGINQWGPSGTYEGADLMRLLNGFYIGKSGSECKYCTGGGQATCSETCTADSLKNKNMKVLTNTANGMIENAVWDTYGVTKADVRDVTWAPTAYLQEKGISAQNTGKNLCAANEGLDSCNSSVESTISWTGLVGLMSVADITYADGWLYNQSGTSLYSRTISPNADTSNAYYVWYASDGNTDRQGASYQRGVFASVYLKSNIKIIGGNGDDKPYILGL